MQTWSSSAGRDALTDADAARGLAARSNLQAGHILRAVDLTRPDLVQRNDIVTLTYSAPGITLTMRGKALDNGAEGDAISVLNEQSKRTLQGIVTGPGRVSFTTEAPRYAANVAR
jgi:flagella basal body P-ring formation protein FlgA